MATTPTADQMIPMNRGDLGVIAVPLRPDGTIDEELYIAEAVKTRTGKPPLPTDGPFWLPEDPHGPFGLRAVGDGVANDGPAIRACIDEMRAYAIAHGRQPQTLLGTGTYRVQPEGSEKVCIKVDVSLITIDGGRWMSCTRTGTKDATITNSINDYGTYIFLVHSSDVEQIAGSPHNQKRTALRRLWIDGDGMTSGIYWGNASGKGFNAASGKVAHATAHNLVVTRCGIGLDWRDNAYMNQIRDSSFSINRVGWRHDTLSQTNVDSGERLTANGVDFTGNGAVFDLNSDGAFHFHDISMSYNYSGGRIAQGAVYITQLHFENNAPSYPGFFNISAGGALYATPSRYLVRNGRSGATSPTFPAGTNKTAWGGNTTARWRVGQAFQFLGPGLPTGVTAATNYYFLAIDEAGFTFSATRGGAAVTWTGSGTSTGMDSVGDSPMFWMASTYSSVTLDGGHVAGSSDEFQYWADGPGRHNFLMEKTTTFNGDLLRVHNRPEGDLADPFFNGANDVKTAVLDEWMTGASVTYSINGTTSEVLNGSHTITLTSTTAAGTTAYQHLRIPITRDRWLLTFDFIASAANFPITYYVSAFYSPYQIAGPVVGTELWQSPLDVTGAPGASSSKRIPTSLVIRPPAWARYLYLRFNLTAAPVGGTLKIANLRFSQY